MSLLWRTAAWWNNDRDYEYEGDDEYPLRDPNEHPKDRGQRYVSQIVDRHNVTRGAAEKALKHVLQHHDHSTIFKSPEDYGFASSANQMSHYSGDMIEKLMDPATWQGRKVQQVALHQPLHATQNFIRPKSIAHNLFHPGKKQPEYEEGAVGDPDVDPNDMQSDEDEWYEEGGETPEQRELHKNVFFMKRHNGRMEVVDGHHRVAADMLLGKSHTPGIVIHERELEGGRPYSYRNPTDPHGPKAMRTTMNNMIKKQPENEQVYRDWFREKHGIE